MREAGSSRLARSGCGAEHPTASNSTGSRHRVEDMRRIMCSSHPRFDAAQALLQFLQDPFCAPYCHSRRRSRTQPHDRAIRVENLPRPAPTSAMPHIQPPTSTLPCCNGSLMGKPQTPLNSRHDFSGLNTSRENKSGSMWLPATRTRLTNFATPARATYAHRHQH